MSKSKKNTVDPTDIIETYGADTARWFMLSDSPPERDVIWTEDGVQGSWRFVQRVWRLIGDIAEKTGPLGAAPDFSGTAAELRGATHKTLAAVSKDLESLGFNRAVARIYEFVNQIGKALHEGVDSADMAYAVREAGEYLIQMMAPMMPHLAEECWTALGREGLISETPWPAVDESLLVDDTVTLPIQINGKKRGEITVQRDASKEAVEAATLQLDFVQRVLEGRTPRKIIVVPQRIVNVVA
jgi:leucyl-tRNA synthetase